VPLQNVQIGFDWLIDFFADDDFKFHSPFPEPLHFGQVADVSTDPAPPHLEQLGALFPWQTGQTFSMTMIGCDRPTNHSPANAIINRMVRKYLIIYSFSFARCFNPVVHPVPLFSFLTRDSRAVRMRLSIFRYRRMPKIPVAMPRGTQIIPM